ncbi:alpha/beta-hydrolase [Cylindrobasidium torrendii FP15055 ss-10]|uniref:Alpha/beta-hydrolase n=1 Tax=Cylindrobasidium torrendii FP15055 ss-10 TaxID=1314674 RepID=A0A0D7AX17_9AGAR|nr:alpha/beta-hydrolase [Cylindrobasidium torrendii FP15055 ss-10]
MAHVPLIGRLAFREYVLILFGFVLLAIENSLGLIILCLLPKTVINWFYKRSRSIFNYNVRQPTAKSPERKASDRVLHAMDFQELCEIHGYTPEEHVVLTKDGYLLGLHRLPSKAGMQKNSPGTSTGKPVIYMHHGLLMNSEVWVCITDAERCLPFRLVEAGYDVWLGNNRGNKYSKKSIHHNPNSTKFWDFSIDDFAWHDIPDSIEYILNITKAEKLNYIGFSQGTAQAFAALSIHPQLNERINVFIALAPAMSPAGLSQPMVDALMKTSPSLLYLLFGRKSLFSGAIMWQSILYPPIFSAVIDKCLVMLFNWRSNNISPYQKICAYAHLYSFTSTKAVVHWFQIMRNRSFLMYDDDYTNMSPVARTAVRTYKPARFPTRNIVTPIVLMYGDVDSLVDIDVMVDQLPKHTQVRRLAGYEHLDILWGRNVDKEVIPHVLETLDEYHGKSRSSKLNGFHNDEHSVVSD